MKDLRSERLRRSSRLTKFFVATGLSKLPYEFAAESMSELNTHYNIFPDYSRVYLHMTQYEEIDRAKDEPFKVKLYDRTGERRVLVRGNSLSKSSINSYKKGIIHSPYFMHEIFDKMRNGEIMYNPSFIKYEPELILDDFDIHFIIQPPKNGRKDKDLLLPRLVSEWKPVLLRKVL